MIKLIHAADFHLDAPFVGRTPEQAEFLRRALLQIPGKVAALCRQEQCHLMLLSGDLFDGAYTAESLYALRSALEEAAVPVFISPGNHDHAGPASPWLTESFPANVHIFTRPVMEQVYVEHLDCHVYGAGFTAMDCPGLLKDFHAGEGRNLGVLHGDPTQVSSPYCPITQSQAADSGLQYLALGHIHKAGSFRAGNTLCAWPGCPMGRGYDEQGEKGVLIVTADHATQARFVPLDVPKFYDLQTPPAGLDGLLPPVGSDDFYRITLTGESAPLDLAALSRHYRRFPNLELRDRTVPPVDIWKNAGEDSFEGAYFRLLREGLADADPQTQSRILLAARLSRQLLDGQEVTLP